MELFEQVTDAGEGRLRVEDSAGLTIVRAGTRVGKGIYQKRDYRPADGLELGDGLVIVEVEDQATGFVQALAHFGLGRVEAFD